MTKPTPEQTELVMEAKAARWPREIVEAAASVMEECEGGGILPDGKMTIGTCDATETRHY